MADYKAKSKRWKLQIYKRRCLYELGVGKAFLKHKSPNQSGKKWLQLLKVETAPKDTISIVEKISQRLEEQIFIFLEEQIF